MKIWISYGFCTDGDYSLRNLDILGCTEKQVTIEDTVFDYIGVIYSENENESECKLKARTFLQKLLCDCIDISYTHYWLIKDFYIIIDSLIDFIDENNSGELYKEMDGNYNGTYIKVQFL